MSVETTQVDRNITTWLSRVMVPEGYKKMSLSETLERREYGVPVWKEKDCEHLGKREYRSLWCDFDASPIIYDQKLKEVISDRNKYTKFLQDHFYRRYKGYPLHAWYRLPEEEKEILFYNRIAYECGHPEYMIATSNTNGYTFESSREMVGVRKNDAVYRKMGK